MFFTWRWGNLRTSAGWPGRSTWEWPSHAKQHSCRSVDKRNIRQLNIWLIYLGYHSLQSYISYKYALIFEFFQPVMQLNCQNSNWIIQSQQQPWQKSPNLYSFTKSILLAVKPNTVVYLSPTVTKLYLTYFQKMYVSLYERKPNEWQD